MAEFMRILTTEDVIRRFKKTHKNTYDYSKVKYVGIDEKVNIRCNIHGIFSQTPYSHMKGFGCRKCGVIRMKEKQKSGKIEFIKRAIKIHGLRYDYRNFIYVNSRTKGEITCSVHGPFFQSPHHHLRGHGCFLCCTTGISKGINFYLNKFVNVHGLKYDYSTFINKKLRVHDFIYPQCPIHGVFKVTVNNHKKGRGCPSCGIISRIDKNRLDQKYILKQCSIIHGNKYNYSGMVYKGKNYKMKIICPIHGPFIRQQVIICGVKDVLSV